MHQEDVSSGVKRSREKLLNEESVLRNFAKQLY